MFSLQKGSRRIWNCPFAQRSGRGNGEIIDLEVTASHACVVTLSEDHAENTAPCVTGQVGVGGQALGSQLLRLFDPSG